MIVQAQQQMGTPAVAQAPGAQEPNCFNTRGGRICCGMIMFIFFALAVSGIILYGLASSTDPETDFKLLGGSQGCLIKSHVITHKTECESKGGCRCDETQTFSFCLPDDRGAGCTEYKSKSNTERACDGTCEDCPTELNFPKWEDGDSTKCWKATGKGKVGFPYRCGNTPSCYKIFDPADEARGVKLIGIGLMVPGLVLFAFGLACIKLTQSQERRKQQEAATAAATAVPTTLAVTIPEGMGPGAVLTIANPNGSGTVDVTVPPNAPPGTVIHVPVAPQQPIAVVAATVVTVDKA